LFLQPLLYVLNIVFNANPTWFIYIYSDARNITGGGGGGAEGGLTNSKAGGLLSMEVGDLVEIFTGPLQDGMAFGRLTRSGKAGFFPVSHVRTMGLFREDPNTGSMHEAANKAVALR
jgi:hypothetical protein